MSHSRKFRRQIQRVQVKRINTHLKELQRRRIVKDATQKG